MTPREFAQRYPQIEERIAPHVAGGFKVSEAFCESRDVRRFFRRVGVLNTSAKSAASKTILEVLDAISQSTSSEPEAAKVVLSAYCASDNANSICTEQPRCDDCPLADSCAFFARKPTIKQLPENERPRERLLALGQQQLTDAELLAIIIGGGTTEHTAVELARMLITRFEGLRGLSEASPAELAKMRGIGSARAAAIKAALEMARRYNSQPQAAKPGAFLNPHTVFEYYRPKIGAEKREVFYVMLLDVKNRLIRDVMISKGSLTQSIVHPREVFEPAIRDSAASVIFVHNHPSGDVTPSPEDIEITKRLRETGDIIGIRVLDHIIVGESAFKSFASEGLLKAAE